MVLGGILALGIVASIIDGEDDAPQPDTPAPTATPTPAATPEPINTQVSDEIKEIAIMSMIADFPLVRDAAIRQDGNELRLVIVVSPAANDEYAKELGEVFVRRVKGLSPDDPPSKDIGRGIYDYLVGVFYPTGERPIAQGAKVSFSTRISW